MKLIKAFRKFQPATVRVTQEHRGPKPVLLMDDSRPFFDGVARLTDVTGLTGTRVTDRNRSKLRRAYGLRRTKHKRPARITRRRPEIVQSPTQ